jgi:hypothetical protein
MAHKKVKKTKQLVEFVDGLVKHVSEHSRLPKNTIGKRESSIQGQLFSIFVEYLEEYYKGKGLVSYREKASGAFYWEGQDNKNNRKVPQEIFTSRNYPDFVIRQPYSIAIEYKQSSSGSLIKQAIGQSFVHILNEEYGFVYILFNDQTKDESIKESLNNPKEKSVCEALWNNFNIKLHVV